MFKNHESIQRIKLANFHHRQTFGFRYVSVKEVKKELINSSSKKVKEGEIPAKILKDSLSVYAKELTALINNCLKDGLFPNELKLADASPVFKKDMIQTRKSIDLSAYPRICQRFLKEFSINKSIISWHQSFHLFHVVLGKIITL